MGQIQSVFGRVQPVIRNAIPLLALTLCIMPMMVGSIQPSRDLQRLNDLEEHEAIALSRELQRFPATHLSALEMAELRELARAHGCTPVCPVLVQEIRERIAVAPSRGQPHLARREAKPAGECAAAGGD